ncbi:MAG: XRE family transcriptional regulator [Azospirillum brasilense]|nr:MAG: XRE family transcriptional regulator [Azospirillum brasilense]
MDICIIAGNNIRELRLAKGWSQDELAHRAHTDRPYLSLIENGKKNITLLMLQELASALGVRPADLLK